MPEKVTRKLSAIMFTDIVGYTAMMQNDELAGLANVKRYRKELGRLVSKYHGEILQHYGDGSLTTFPSAVDSVHCAYELQLALQPLSKSEGHISGVPLRIGLHIGDIIIQEDDIYGNGVNVASRIESLGQAGTILFSQSIYEKISSIPDFQVTYIGSYHFKNVKEPMKIYALGNEKMVVPDPKSITGKLEPKTQKGGMSKKRALVGASVLAIAAIFLWFQFIYLPASRNVIDSIAVLPFENQTNNEEAALYLAGLHEALISELGQIEALRVISKTSMQRFRETEKSVPEIAEQLGVEAVVETSVFQVDSLVRMKVSLIRAFPEEKQLWSEIFTRDFTHILDLYRSVTGNIVEKMKLALLPEEAERLQTSEAVNSEAYAAFLKARNYWGTLSREGLQKALEYYELSVKKDPTFAPGYGGIASVWGARQQMGLASREVAVPQIKTNLEKALSLDNHLAESYYNLALNNVWTFWDWSGAEKAFQNTLEINPNFAEAHAYYSHFLMTQDRPVEMKMHMDKALELDPYNPLLLVLQAVEFIMFEQPDAAIQNVAELEKLAPNSVLIQLVLWLAYHQKDNTELAYEKQRNVLQLVSDSSVVKTFEDVYALSGYTAALEAAADHWASKRTETFVPPDNIYFLYATAGNKEKTMDWLEVGYEMHDSNIPYIGSNTFIINLLHDEPRFLTLIEKLNLPLVSRLKG